MPELDQQLRGAIDPVPPITLAELEGRHHRDPIRRRLPAKTVAVGIALAAAIAVAVIVVANQPAKQTPTQVVVGSNTATHPASSSLTTDGLTVSLTVRRPRLPSGTPVTGELILDNHSGHAINQGSACPGFELTVNLKGHNAFAPLGSDVTCTHPYMLKVGRTVLPFEIPTRHDTPGVYRTNVIVDSSLLPLPAPLHVTLTGLGRLH